MSTVTLTLVRQGFDAAKKDSAEVAQSIDALKRKEAELGAQLDKLNQKRREATQASRILAAQTKAGVAADTAAGKAIADEIRLYDRLETELRQVRAAAAATTREKKNLGGEMRSAGSSAGMLGSKIAGIAAGFISLQAAAAILRKAIGAIGEAEEAAARLETVMQRAGRSGELAHLTDEAERFSKALGVDDEAVTLLQAKMGKFEDLGIENFDRAVRVAIDLAAEMTEAGGNIEDNFTEAGEAIGKFAQEPEEALSRLERTLGKFSDAQAKAIIDAAKMGDEARAQALGLDLVEGRVSGLAAAHRNNLSGAMHATSVEFENQLELLQEGLSPAIRQIAEDFATWSQSAAGQQKIVEIGRQLGEVIATAATMTKTLADSLSDIDPGRMSNLLSVSLELAERLATVVGWLLKISEWTPGSLILRGLDTLIGKARDLADNTQAALRGLDPRAAIGISAAVESSTGGMTPAQRALWDEAEAQADAAHRRALREQEDSRQRAAEEAKRLKSSRDALQKLTDAIEEESEERRRAVQIGSQEGVSQRDRIKQIREAEIETKALKKVEEVRLASLRAGIVLTDANAAAIRRWVIEGEHAVDTTAALNAAVTKFAAIPAIDTSQIDAAIERFNAADQEFRRSRFEIEQANQASIDEHNQAIYDDLVDQAINLKESLKTPAEQLAYLNALIDELGKQADSTGRKILSESEIADAKASALFDYQQGQLDSALGLWGNFFSTLAGEFGGFFNQIASLMQRLQSAAQMGSTVKGIAGSMGASPGAASMIGGAAGGVMIFATVLRAIYEFNKARDEAQRLRQYMVSAANYGQRDSYGNWVISGMYDGAGELTQQSREASKAIARSMEEIAAAIGGTLEQFKGIEIKARNDGKYFEAWVGQEFLGRFTTFDDAVKAALKKSLFSAGTVISGLSDLVKQGLGELTAGKRFDTVDIDEARDFLSALREISELGLAPGVLEIRQLTAHFTELWRTLSIIDEMTPAVAKGFSDIGQGLVDSFQAQFDAITGRQKSAEEIAAEKRRQLEMLKAERDLEIARQKLMIIDLQRQAEALKKRGEIIRIGGELEGVEIGGKLRYIGLKTELVKAEAQVDEERLKLIAAQIAAISQIIAGLENLQIPDITLPDVKPIRPGGGRSGPSRGDQRKDLRQEIAQMEADARGGLFRTILDLQERIADFKERAKEAKLPAEELARALDLMREATKKAILAEARQRAGIGTDFTRSLEETLDFFKQLKDLGREKTGIEDWRVDALKTGALKELGAQLAQAIGQFSGLLDPMAAINAQAAELRENVLAYAKAAGWSAEQIAAAMAQIEGGVEAQRQAGINSILGQIFDVLRESGQFEAERQAFARQEIELRYRLFEAELAFYGALDDVTRGILDAARDLELAGITAGEHIVRATHPVQGPGWTYEQLRQAADDAVAAWRSAIQAFAQSQRELMTDDSLSGLTQAQQLEAARARMNELVAQAQGGSVEALGQLSAAQREFLAEYQQSFGWVDPQAWADAMGPAADLLANAQSIEGQVMQAAMTAAMHANDNTAALTDAIYAAAQQVADAIYLSIGNVPGYAAGGYIDHPHLAMVGENGPEFILPVFPGWRNRGDDIRLGNAFSTNGPRDAHFRRSLDLQDRMTRDSRSNRRANESTARSSRMIQRAVADLASESVGMRVALRWRR